VLSWLGVACECDKRLKFVGTEAEVGLPEEPPPPWEAWVEPP